MATKKAGCVLIDIKNKMICLIERESYNDLSFPKGHLEEGETYVECAIRETEEETKRKPLIVSYLPFIETYVTSKGEKCSVRYYLAIDNGKSNNKSFDTHPVKWVKYDEVLDNLSYDNLKKLWIDVSDFIKKLVK